VDRKEALTILGIEAENPTHEEINDAYRTMALLNHPDAHQNNQKLKDAAEHQMRRINEARDYLIKGRSAEPRARRQPEPTAEPKTDRTAGQTTGTAGTTGSDRGNTSAGGSSKSASDRAKTGTDSGQKTAGDRANASSGNGSKTTSSKAGTTSDASTKSSTRDGAAASNAASSKDSASTHAGGSIHQQHQAAVEKRYNRAVAWLALAIIFAIVYADGFLGYSYVTSITVRYGEPLAVLLAFSSCLISTTIIATAMTDYQKTWLCWIGGIVLMLILGPFGELLAMFVSALVSAETNPNTGLVLIAAVAVLAAVVFMHAAKKARLRKKA